MPALYPGNPKTWRDNDPTTDWSAAAANDLEARMIGEAIAQHDDAVGKSLQSTSNLADLGNVVTARQSLGLDAVFQGKTAAPAYSTSITPDASQGIWQTITVTNTTAFTINAPTNPPAAGRTQELTIEIFNSSGGAMGVITWNAAFVFTGTAFTNPANTKKRFARFIWNGTKWVATSVAGADY